MAFVDTPLEEDLSRFESADAEKVLEMTQVGRGRRRRRLIAVAILADMERQGRTLAVVVRPYGYEHQRLQDRLEIPIGFITDFASIPGAVQFLIQPFGRHAPAAVIHDYLYAIGEKGRRKYADRLFLEAMKDSGVPYIRRSIMYRMVRFFGGRGYGLDADWSFVDHESGQPIDPPLDRPVIQYRTKQELAALRKAAKVEKAAT